MKESIENQGYWREQSSLWESSGLSQKKFCEQAGLSYRRFVYWWNLLKEDMVAQINCSEEGSFGVI